MNYSAYVTNSSIGTASR